MEEQQACARPQVQTQASTLSEERAVASSSMLALEQRMMLESSLARADRERMIESAPTWCPEPKGTEERELGAGSQVQTHASTLSEDCAVVSPSVLALGQRMSFESCLARADRGRMMQDVEARSQLPENPNKVVSYPASGRSQLQYKPAWVEDAAKFGGNSFSVGGFNNGYDIPREFNTPTSPSKDRLERNFFAAIDALEALNRPWPTSPSVTTSASKPLTGWVAWGSATGPSEGAVSQKAAQKESLTGVDGIGVERACVSPSAKTLFRYRGVQAPAELQPEEENSPSGRTPEAQEMVNAQLEKLRLMYDSMA